MNDMVYLLTYHDELTGLSNEKHFKEELKNIINLKDNKNKLIILLEISNLTKINNIFGYEKSNELLKDFSTKLKNMKPKIGIDLISVYNGNQFLLLCDSACDNLNINKKLNILIAHLNNFFEQMKLDHILNINLGISIYPNHAKEVSSLLSKAHHALYLAKETNKNYVVYDEDKFLKVRKNEILQSELKQAVENCELYIEYQPKINIKKNEKIGALEALIRWKHPNKGLISPGDFIPKAEKNGLIQDIDMFVIKEVLEQIKLWLKKDIKIKVCINISPQELNDDKFIKNVEKIFNEYKVEKNFVEFEITERAFTEVPLKQLLYLKKIGLTIALDDFGTGYSSLNYFQKYPVIDVLKIDKSFIENISHEKTQQLLKSIINLSHDLDITVVAEGVENEVQYNFVKELDFDFVQGFYFYKSLSPNKLEKVFSK